MALKLNTPLYVEQSERWIYPNAGNVTADDRLFIVCDNNVLAEILITNINELLSHRSLTPVQLSELADEIITSGNKDFSSSSLALLLLNKNSCLSLQMGKSRIVHLSPTTGDIEYDSSNHILDSYNSKAKTQLINRISGNDVIILTLADRVDTQRLLSMVCNASYDDDNSLLNGLSLLIGKHREQPPATYYLRFLGAGSAVGKISNFIKDINWKWIIIFLVLAAIIAGVAMFSLNGNRLHFYTEEQQIEIPTDSDSINVLEPAIQDISEIDEITDASIKKNSDSLKLQQDITKNESVKKEIDESHEPVVKNETETDPINSIEQTQEDPTAPQVSPTPIPENPQ